MNKKLATLAMAGVLTLGFGTSIFANQTITNLVPTNQFNINSRSCCFGGGMMGIRGMMWDENGNFLERSTFSNRLDLFIIDGSISADSRDFFLEMYDFCATYGGGSNGIFGNCVAGGRRGSMGRGNRMAW